MFIVILFLWMLNLLLSLALQLGLQRRGGKWIQGVSEPVHRRGGELVQGGSGTRSIEEERDLD